MPDEFISDQIGNSTDTVSIQIGNVGTGDISDVVYCTDWDITESILQQPSHWTLSMGNAQVAREQFFDKFPPGSTIWLKINDHIQFTGQLDSRGLEMRPGSTGMSFVVRGRDKMAKLHDSFVAAARSFKDKTYQYMVQEALKASGLDPSLLVLSNTANRTLKATVDVTEVEEPQTVEIINAQALPGTIGATAQELQAKCGERWHDFLRRHLDRAGLMLWSGADGSFILSAPNTSQKPLYSIYRRYTQTAAETNILASSLSDDCTNRHTEVIVYGRGGGRKFGKVKAKGAFEDQEMLDYGYEQPIVFRDTNCKTGVGAEYYARRKLAEERRNGWQLRYTMAGNTLPYFNNSSVRAVITPDTIVSVDDEILGIKGEFYVDTVHRTRNPQTQTTVRLVRPGDLFFQVATEKSTPAVQPTPQTTADGGESVIIIKGAVARPSK